MAATIGSTFGPVVRQLTDRRAAARSEKLKARREDGRSATYAAFGTRTQDHQMDFFTPTRDTSGGHSRTNGHSRLRPSSFIDRAWGRVSSGRHKSSTSPVEKKMFMRRRGRLVRATSIRPLSCQIQSARCCSVQRESFALDSWTNARCTRPCPQTRDSVSSSLV
jgi:hypothetical protein